MPWLDASSFPLRSSPPSLATEAIHLWLWREPGKAGRDTVRDLLAAYLGREPGALTLRRNTYGKPLLEDAGLHCNWSHSGELWALALARHAEVGVDVEMPRRERDVLALAQRFFAPTEAAALAALQGAARLAAFYTLWTGKEAVLKALGRGIAFGLERLEFAFDRGSPGDLRWIAPEGGPAAAWQVVRFAPQAATYGALAWHGPAREVSGFRPA
jgi:4'-phosphopantetheinyl transferase